MSKKSSEKSEDVYSSFFDAELKMASKTMGRSNILVADEAKARKYGIEIPSLALQYVLQSDVLFMEHLILLAGKTKSHKTSFAIELSRWVMEHGGFARLFDTEQKYSPSLADNILLGLCNERTWQVFTCDNLDIWMESFTKLMTGYRDYFKIRVPTKRSDEKPNLLPFCFIVDSLTGKTTQENIDSFEKDGKASNTAGMRTAKAITDFIQTQNFIGMPGYIVMIRHEKDGAAMGGFAGRAAAKQTPGGKAPDFIGGIDLRFSVIEQDRKEHSGYNLVQIKCHKNAFGPDGHRCGVRFSWQYTEVDGQMRQIPRWEWDLATAQLLANFDRADIKDICHVTESGSKANPTYSCKQLGLVEVTGDELGTAIRHDPKLYSDLQNYLHITRCAKFDPVVSRLEE